MKSSQLILSALFLLGSLFTLSSYADMFPQGFELKGGPVLVEIYTSQGCSSCPPADRVMHAMQEEAKAKGIPVHVISWHVDYWDKLRTHHGVWKDSFSHADYTARQREYAQVYMRLGQLDRNRVYTPQIVINGTDYMRERRNTPSFAKQVAQRSEATGKLKIQSALVKQEEGNATLSWSLGEDLLPKGARLTAVLVEHDLVTEVTKGENAGKTLNGLSVVRAAATATNGGKGELTLALPAELNPENADLLLFVQDKDLNLLGLTRSSWKAFSAALPAAEDQVALALDKIGVCVPGEDCSVPQEKMAAKASGNSDS